MYIEPRSTVSTSMINDNENDFLPRRMGLLTKTTVTQKRKVKNRSEGNQTTTMPRARKNCPKEKVPFSQMIISHYPFWGGFGQFFTFRQNYKNSRLSVIRGEAGSILILGHF